MRLQAAILLLAFTSITLGATAQDTPDKKQEPEKPKEVVVSASRLEEPARDVASSVTVISGDAMERSQHRRVSEALRDVPALDVVQTGPAGGHTSVFLRGANSEHTLVLIDGVEANDPIAAGRSFNFANLSADNIERIEVLRGPQSVLYGSDALGGVVNIITRRGKGDPKVVTTAEAGRFGTYLARASVAGGTDRAYYSFGASRLQTAGISSAASNLGNSEKDGYWNETFSTRFGFTPGDGFDIDFAVRAMQGRTEIDNGGGAGQDDPNRTVDSRQWLLRVAPRLQLLEGLWEQTLALSVSESAFEDDNPPDPASAAFSFSTFDSRFVDLDWQHNLRLHETNTLTIGAEFEQDRGESAGDFGGFLSVFPSETAATRGVYVQDRVHLWEQLTLTAGARVDKHDRFGTHATYRGTVAYFVGETSTKLRATLGTGFKSPSLFQLFSSFGDPNLKPEESIGWDAGVEQDLFAGKLTASVTYFRNRFHELIDFDGALGKYVNVGRVETDGIEAAMRATIFDRFELQASYSLTEAEDVRTKLDLVRRPHHKGGVMLSYAATDAIRFGASLLYVGRRKDFDFATFPATRVTLDDYLLLGLTASYRINERFEAFARVENALNQEYEEVLGFGVPGVALTLGGSASF